MDLRCVFLAAIMLRPVHFEIHASNLDRARTFYESVFHWKFEQWGDEPYWLIRTGDGPGIDGGLMPRQGQAPAENAPITSFVNTVEVADLEATLDTLTSAGGQVAMPRNAVPTVGWLAYCKDTEGNIFGLLQSDPNAG
jgi:predicted enzyme related to lactoylglutathione lyase